MVVISLLSPCHLQPRTPLEPCEWLNKLLMDIWPNFIEPKLSFKFSSIVEVRIRLNRRFELLALSVTYCFYLCIFLSMF